MAEDLTFAELEKQFQEEVLNVREAEAPAPEVLKRTLSDGTEVTGATQDELFANAEKYYSSKGVIQDAKPVIPFPAQPQAVPVTPVVAEKRRLDLAKWAEAIQRDPAEAAELVDEIRFGGNPVEIIKQLREGQVAQEKALVNRELKLWQRENKDVDLKDPQTAQALKYVLDQHRLGVSEESLDFAKQQAMANNWIRPRAEASPVKAPAPTPPPSVPQGSVTSAPKTGAGADFMAKFMAQINDPDTDFEKLNALAGKAGMYSPGSLSKLTG